MSRGAVGLVSQDVFEHRDILGLPLGKGRGEVQGLGCRPNVGGRNGC